MQLRCRGIRSASSRHDGVLADRDDPEQVAPETEVGTLRPALRELRWLDGHEAEEQAGYPLGFPVDREAGEIGRLIRLRLPAQLTAGRIEPTSRVPCSN